MRTVEDWTKVGDTLYGLKRYEEALAAFERAIRLDPTSYNYGFFKLTTRARKDQAVSVIVTAGVCKSSVARSEADKHFFLAICSRPLRRGRSEGATSPA